MRNTIEAAPVAVETSRTGIGAQRGRSLWSDTRGRAGKTKCEEVAGCRCRLARQCVGHLLRFAVAPRPLAIPKRSPLAPLAGRGAGGEGFWDRLLAHRRSAHLPQRRGPPSSISRISPGGGGTTRWPFRSCSAGRLSADDFSHSLSTVGLRCARSAALCKAHEMHQRRDDVFRYTTR